MWDGTKRLSLPGSWTFKLDLFYAYAVTLYIKYIKTSKKGI